MIKFTCSVCNKEIEYDNSNACFVGYALANGDIPIKLYGKVYGDLSSEDKICYPCCGEIDKSAMIETGKAVLYVTANKNTGYKITNCPRTLSFQAKVHWKGNHNWGLKVLFVRFIGPDGKIWSGKNIGENSELCFCKRTKLNSLYG